MNKKKKITLRILHGSMLTEWRIVNTKFHMLLKTFRYLDNTVETIIIKKPPRPDINATGKLPPDFTRCKYCKAVILKDSNFCVNCRKKLKVFCNCRVYDRKFNCGHGDDCPGIRLFTERLHKKQQRYRRRKALKEKMQKALSRMLMLLHRIKESFKTCISKFINYF